MRFGYVLVNDFPAGEIAAERVGPLLEQVRAARRAGIDSVWMSQHYLGNMPTLQPWPLLGRISADSGSMKIGTNVFIAPLVHPVECAENFATVDHLSRGNAIAGLGMGYRGNEFESFGIPMEERIGRYTESVEIIRALWSGEPTSYRGEHFALDEQRISLTPLNPGGLPIWIGAGPHTKGAKRAAALGDAWIMAPHVTLAEIARLQGIYRAELEALGRPLDGPFVVRRDVFLDHDPERAFRLAGEARLRQTESYAQFDLPDRSASYRHLEGDVATGAQRVAEESYLFTDPAGCIAGLRELEELGIDYVILRMQWPGMPQEETLRSLELFRDEVMPSFTPSG
jgi:alkanesulfonate monooxygenase SsuD/methylene tetrahydromethanopterin reductase-like flavin-dependent oxidoreductase (luciferase family)